MSLFFTTTIREDVEIEVDVECSRCGAALTATSRSEHIGSHDENHRLVIHPCTTCYPVGATDTESS